MTEMAAWERQRDRSRITAFKEALLDDDDDAFFASRVASSIRPQGEQVSTKRERG